MWIIACMCVRQGTRTIFPAQRFPTIFLFLDSPFTKGEKQTNFMGNEQSQSTKPTCMFPIGIWLTTLRRVLDPIFYLFISQNLFTA